MQLSSNRIWQTRLTVLLVSCLAFSNQSVLAALPCLRFDLGDHVSYIGNTLADRMQHGGWLETLLQNRFGQHQLVFRNLGFPGDEIDQRPRSENFGSPDDWLTKNGTDVVFAFFGYNESFAGEVGLDGFREKVASWIGATRGQMYNGESAPRIVLFSPIAHEDLRSPHLPDGSENNQRLAMYTNAMSEVASEKGVVFVDLFALTRDLYGKAKAPLTINGIHLTPEGNRHLAEIIDRALFGNSVHKDSAALEKLREAVLDKNFLWFNRYRTVDGYNVYGGRSKLSWHGQSNADVMQREMQVFDVMTANRDKRIWAVAAGGDLKVDDSNTPDLLEVKTNEPGPLEGNGYPFLGGVEAIDKMKVAEGMEINLFASEEQFPELVNPVQMSVDGDGRLWVATWPTYPHWNPKEQLSDKIVILPDENRDGKADQLIVFAEGLNSVTGFEFWGGGLLVAAAPEIWFLKDTDGDDKADMKIRMLQGVSSADTHHTANSLVIGPDGALYYSRGIFNVSSMETPTKTFRSTASGVYRFDPRTFEVDFHFPIGVNPHGDVFDQWGYQFANDGTSGKGAYVSIGKGVKSPKQWFTMRVRPVAATGILSSSHFPQHNNGNFLICNAIGFLGVLQHKVEYDGADINAVEIEPIVVSSDPNFRPTDLEIGSDGALYISDWCNPLIGHMQHNMRDPNRDHLHGRVYRVTVKGRDLLPPVKIRGKPIAQVLEQFRAKENAARYRARLELSGRETSDVTAALASWTAGIQPNNPENEQLLLESLWVYQEHRVPNEELLKKVFTAQEPRVRAASIRVLGAWGLKVKNWAPLLLAAARDSEPLVRAEAAKAAVSFEGRAAAEAIFEVATRSTDVQLDFVLKYAREKLQVDRIVQEAIHANQKISPASRRYALRYASVSVLLKMERTEAACQAILSRSGVAEAPLREALASLAKIQGADEIGLVLKMLGEQDDDAGNAVTLARLLVAQPAEKLREVTDQLAMLAANGKKWGVRSAAYAAWITAEGAAGDAYLQATKSTESLRAILDAVALIPDEKVRAAMFSQIRQLAFDLPSNLKREKAGSAILGRGIKVDYFEPHPDDVATETLAQLKPAASGIVPEIQVDVPQLKQRDAFALRFTGALQIDNPGKYTFFVNSDDGSRLYLGKELVVNNDGDHSMDEKNGAIQLTAGAHPLVVTYFDSGGADGLTVSYSGPNIKKQKIPARKLLVSGGESLHDVAIGTFVLIPGFEDEKFSDLARLIKTGRNRNSAIRAMRQVPKANWVKGQAQALVDNLVAYASEIPVAYRTGPAALEAIALAKDLTALLPDEKAEAATKRLENLDVRVIAIGTVAHRMLYDKESITVEAGKPVEFRFSNTDAMPHNFAITLPGAMEEIGLLAEATARDSDAMARHYIPKSDKILVASRLLQPGESHAFIFIAPEKPGVYPYVCTYPGHWRRMYGALYVVADLDTYQENPEKYLAKHELPIQDELLELVGKGRQWQLDDILEFVQPLEAGRSFEVGQNAFTVSSCVSCHRMGKKEGLQVGSDLTQLDPKKKNAEHILRSLLNPSEKIEEKFQAHIFRLDSGKTVTGMILEETADKVTVIENPLAKTKPIVLATAEIEARKKSEMSIMPEGLANKLTREEILDLVAYVLSSGKKDDKLFQGGHEHHHNH